MSHCHKVLLYSFNALTKILALNIFGYNRRKNKFENSTFWFYYLMIYHLLFIWPINLIVLTYVKDERPTQELSFERISIRTYECIIIIHNVSVAVQGWTILQYRHQLCELLNRLLSIVRLHRQIFGRSISVSWFFVAIHLLRELYRLPIYCYHDKILYEVLCLLAVRIMVANLISDVSMMIHLECIKSLAKHLAKLKSPSQQLRRADCIEYFEQLMQLKHGLQQLSWVSSTARLITEIIFSIYSMFFFYWTSISYGGSLYIVKGLVRIVCLTNMLQFTLMARRIDEMEKKILDRLYQHDLLGTLTCQSRKLQDRIEKVINFLGFSFSWGEIKRIFLFKLERLHLKSCYLKERSITILNYIYSQRSLILELVHFLFTTVVLLISFSFKYEISPKYIPNATMLQTKYWTNETMKFAWSIYNLFVFFISSYQFNAI